MDHIRIINDATFMDTIISKVKKARKKNKIFEESDGKKKKLSKKKKARPKSRRVLSSDEATSEEEQKAIWESEDEPEDQTDALDENSKLCQPKPKRRKKNSDVSKKHLINQSYVKGKYSDKSIFGRSYEQENINYYEKCVECSDCTDCQTTEDSILPGCGQAILLNTVTNKKLRQKMKGKSVGAKSNRKKQKNKTNEKAEAESQVQSQQQSAAEEEFACGDCVLFWQYNNWQPQYGGLKIKTIETGKKTIEVSTQDNIAYATFDECNVIFYPFGNHCNIVSLERLVIDDSNKFNKQKKTKWNGRHLCSAHARKYVPLEKNTSPVTPKMLLRGKNILYDVEALPFVSSQTVEQIMNTKWLIPDGVRELMKQQKSSILNQFVMDTDIPKGIRANGTAGLEDSEGSSEETPKGNEHNKKEIDDTYVQYDSESSDCMIMDIESTKRRYANKKKEEYANTKRNSNNKEQDSGDDVTSHSDSQMNEDNDLGHSSNETFIVD